MVERRNIMENETAIVLGFILGLILLGILSLLFVMGALGNICSAEVEGEFNGNFDFNAEVIPTINSFVFENGTAKIKIEYPCHVALLAAIGWNSK